MRLPTTGNSGKRRLAVRLGWLVALLTLFMDRQIAFAQTKSWSGVVSGLWSDPGNWVGGQIPVDGDSLLFPYYGSFSHNMWNDIPGLTLGSVTATAYTDFVVGGETVTLTGDLSFQSWNVPTILGASVRINAHIGNVVDLNGHDLTLWSNVTGSIVGTGSVTTEYQVSLLEGATSSFTGPLTVTSGTNLWVAGTLSNASPFTVSSSAYLTVSGSISVPLVTVGANGFLSGSGTMTAATLTNATLVPDTVLTTGNLSVQGGTVMFRISLSPGQDSQTQLVTVGTVTLANPALDVSVPWNPPVTGDSFVLIDNDGTDPVSGTFAGLPEGAVFAVGDTSFRITYSGGTGNDVVLTAEAWNGPKRWLGATSALWSVPANWLEGVPPVDGDSLFFPYFGSFSHNMWNDVPGLTLASVTASGGNDFTVGGETVILAGSLNFPYWNVPTLLGAPATMEASNFGNVIDLNGQALTISGYLSGSIVGAGSVVANGLGVSAGATVSFVGGLTVPPGASLGVAGTISGSTLSVGAEGTLSGSGTVPAVSLVNAWLVPSDVLTTGSLSMQGGRLPIQIRLSPGQDGHWQVNTVGSVMLANPVLDVDILWNPPSPGDSFVIIDNDGADPVSGTFAGLPEGAVFSVDDTSFRISYAGGTGNDVVLTAEAWSGPKRWLGATSALWSVAANWLDGTALVDGAEVFFPYYGSFSHVMWNDVPGLVLGSVTASGPDFSVGGETVTLTGNLDFPTWNLPTILGASLVMRGNFGAPIELGGHALTLEGNLSGPIQGAGSVTARSALYLQGSSAFSGTFTVPMGATLTVAGSISGSPMNVTGGFLRGNGTVPATTVTNGTLTGEVLTTGNLLVQGGQMPFEIRLSPGQDGHSQIRTLGTVTLGNPTLQLSLPWNLPAAGQAFVLIDNDGTDPVSGTFAGLPEGAGLTGAGFSGSAPFRITYAGGTGNDVVVIATATTATTLVSSPNPANTGEAITLSATVFSPAGAPIGEVMFAEGTIVLGTAALDTDGHASITRALGPGTHSIVARYAGSGGFGPSASSPLTQVVNGAPAGTATIPTLGGTALMLLAIGLAAVGARLALR